MKAWFDLTSAKVEIYLEHLRHAERLKRPELEKLRCHFVLEEALRLGE
jgi:hypothetical protein